MLRMRYDELWNEVADSQRERANLKLAPKLEALLILTGKYLWRMQKDQKL